MEAMTLPAPVSMRARPKSAICVGWAGGPEGPGGPGGTGGWVGGAGRGGHCRSKSSSPPHPHPHTLAPGGGGGGAAHHPLSRCPWPAQPPPCGTVFLPAVQCSTGGCAHLDVEARPLAVNGQVQKQVGGPAGRARGAGWGWGWGSTAGGRGGEGPGRSNTSSQASHRCTLDPGLVEACRCGAAGKGALALPQHGTARPHNLGRVVAVRPAFGADGGSLARLVGDDLEPALPALPLPRPPPPEVPVNDGRLARVQVVHAGRHVAQHLQPLDPRQLTDGLLVAFASPGGSGQGRVCAWRVGGWVGEGGWVRVGGSGVGLQGKVGLGWIGLGWGLIQCCR